MVPLDRKEGAELERKRSGGNSPDSALPSLPSADRRKGLATSLRRVLTFLVEHQRKTGEFFWPIFFE